MSASLKKIYRGIPRPGGHGNAGLGSNFIDLAHEKLKPGGVIALVLPLAVASGAAWSGTRNLLARWYRDITVISIAATGSTTRAFSDDTDMGEALILAVKRDGQIEAGPATAPAFFVNRFCQISGHAGLG